MDAYVDAKQVQGGMVGSVGGVLQHTRRGGTASASTAAARRTGRCTRMDCRLDRRTGLRTDRCTDRRTSRRCIRYTRSSRRRTTATTICRRR